MVILNQRRIITPKNIVFLGIILLSTYTYSSDTYSTEFKLLSLKTFKPVPQLNSKFAQLKFDKLLIQSVEAEHEKKIVIKSAKSFPALKFKHVAEEDPKPEKEIVITEDLSQEDLLQQEARQLLQQKQELHKQQQKAILLLETLTENIKKQSIIKPDIPIKKKFNTHWKDIICKDSDPNIMLPNGNTFFYQLLKNIKDHLKNINDHHTYHDQIEFISLCLSQQNWQHGKPDMTIKNEKGNTILHQIMKLFNCNPQLNSLIFKKSENKFDSNYEIHYILFVPDHDKNLYVVFDNLEIFNLNQALKIKNNNNMTPLYYLFTKFHPIQPTQIARRCIERIRNIQKYIDKNGNDINSLIDHIATEKYYDIFQISYTDMFQFNCEVKSDTNPIEKLFNRDPIQYENLVQIDDSLLPLKKKMEESPFYKGLENFCQLRATKDYVDHKAKKRAMLNFLMAYKTRFNKNLLLPTPLKKCIFELIPLSSFELITPLSVALNTIITKREKNTLIIKDDLDCLIDAAAKSTLFSKNNKK